MKKCPVCNSNNQVLIYAASSQPLARYDLCDSIEESKNVSRYDLNIYQCDKCSLIYNLDFDYSNIDYKSNKIQESRVFSPRIHSYMERSARDLIDKLDLKDKIVMEIGCGEGFYLSNFKSIASQVIAFEPSPESELASQKGINIIGEYYNPFELYSLNPKLLILRQVLEHLKDPNDFFNSFYSLLKSEEGYLYVEVPNSNPTKNLKRFYDFYYDHYLYFTTDSLTHLAEAAGFEVIECNEAFDGEILRLLCKVPPLNMKKYYLNYQDKAELIKQYLQRKKSDGKNIVGWGTAGTGTSLLNLCGINLDIIEYVIDSDVRKQKKYIPGTGQLVVSPDYFKGMPPDCILILSQFHKKDITDQAKSIYKNLDLEIIIPDEIS